MGNVRMKVKESCTGCWYNLGIFVGRKLLMSGTESWEIKKAAIRNAKATAKRIGIPYGTEIIKQHGC